MIFSLMVNYNLCVQRRDVMRRGGYAAETERATSGANMKPGSSSRQNAMWWLGWLV